MSSKYPLLSPLKVSKWFWGGYIWLNILQQPKETFCWAFKTQTFVAIILPQRQTASKRNIAKINFEAQSRKIFKLSKLDLKNEIARRSLLHSEETSHRVQSCLYLVNTVVKYPTNIAKFPTKITMKPAEQHHFPWEAKIIILWRSRFFWQISEPFLLTSSIHTYKPVNVFTDAMLLFLWNAAYWLFRNARRVIAWISFYYV